ncbi:MAG: hypothetical protein SPL13_03005 [Clostridia bacterium]|nr:hypothetical protein [Clostridia bacterium]
MEARNVLSPKSKVKEIYNIFDFTDFTIATLKYGDSVRIGIRWNGEKDQLGYPQSHGYPTWFIIPKDVAVSYAKQIGDKDMAKILAETSDKPLL